MSSQLDSLLAQAREVDDEIRRTSATDTWYRGHSDRGWQLVSALHRHVNRMVEPIAEPPMDLVDYLYAEYKTLYRQFKDQAWPLLDEWGRSEWGVIFSMQHYGIPTRLLDWTESFGCALYFAQRDRPTGKPASIWALDPERLNEKTINQNGIVSIDEITTAGDIPTHRWHPRYAQKSRDLPTIAVSPAFSNARMAAQRSRFTLSGDSFQPLDQQYDGSLTSDRILIRIEIPADLYDELDDYLRVMGLRPFTFFPDFEGLRLEQELRVRKYFRDLSKFAPHALKTGRTEGTEGTN